MNGFEYVRSMHSFYRPRTPRAALLAAEMDMLPVEALVYKGSSVKPLFEEPYDPDELERVLARPDLSFTDAMVLAEILVAMTHETDKERALFAAESFTSLENRWARLVEDRRTALAKDGGDEEAIFGLARALYEQALIVGRSAPIRNYYLGEAYYLLVSRPSGPGGGKLFNLRMRCLLRLGLLEQAEAEIREEQERNGISGELLALAVESAYLGKDLRKIRNLLEGLDLGSLGLDRELAALFEFWQG